MSEQSSVTFIIEENGDCTYLMTEAAPLIEGAVTARASHVEPSNLLLRLLFHALRQWLGDKGRMSDFTRAWPCLWRINMQPVGGPILPTLYRDRFAAIDAEVQALNKFFSGEKI